MFIKRYGSGGEGRAFFCLHGWGGDHREFAPLAVRLPSDVTLISADLPGYGKSAQPREWTLSRIVGEIGETLEEMDQRPDTLVGFCTGAILALLTATRYPDTTQRVVLIDPFAFVPWYFAIFLIHGLGEKAYHSTFQSPLGRAVTDWVLKRLQAADADFTRAFKSVDHQVTLRYLDLLSQIDIYKEFASLGMKIDLAFGEHTFRAVKKSVGIYRQLWPQARSFELKGVGHLPLVKGARQLRQMLFLPVSINGK